MSHTVWQPVATNREAWEAEVDASGRALRRLCQVLKLTRWRFNGLLVPWSRRIRMRLEHIVEVGAQHPTDDPWWDEPYRGREF